MSDLRNTAGNLITRMNQIANILGDRKDEINSWLGDFRRLVESMEKIREENGKLVEENRKLVEQNKNLQANLTSLKK